MNRVKNLMVNIPMKLGIPQSAQRRMSKAFELIYDYDAKGVGVEFNRLGNSLKDCENRLDTIFAMMDQAILNYGGHKEASMEAKRLLLLASTPETSVQEEIITTYGDETTYYAEYMTTPEATQIGVRAWWNE